MIKRPIVVDLFSGAGGFSLGFEQAGFDIKVAVEVDPVHAAIHKFNFPDCWVFPHSITDLSGKDIRKQSDIGRKKIHCVIGGAPCQGYSLMGKRAFDDPRNYLVKDFIRVVLELKPDYFVFENVKGLSIGKHKLFLEEIISNFENNGYEIRQPWQVLNAANYGVPQKRERLFLLGGKKGLKLPNYPAPLTRLFQEKGDLPLVYTCKDALKDLPEAEEFESLLKCDRVKTDLWGHPSDYGTEMRCLEDNSWHFGYKRHWNPQLLTSSLRTNHSQKSRDRFLATEPGKIEPISRFFKLAENKVANTLRAGTDAARGSHTAPRPIHYHSPRCITVREMARIGGFADWFGFHVTKWHGARQIGNAVPPPVARAIALEIMKCLELQPKIPQTTLNLGDPKLLSMTMKQAANYWQVAVPIKRK